MKEIKRYIDTVQALTVMINDEESDVFKMILNQAVEIIKEHTDHKAVIETIQKRIEELEAERKQIKSAIDPGYDDINYSIMLLREILKEV